MPQAAQTYSVCQKQYIMDPQSRIRAGVNDIRLSWTEKNSVENQPGQMTRRWYNGTKNIHLALLPRLF